MPVPAGIWAPIDFAAEGVFLLQGWESIASGIWRLNPDTGALSRVADVQFWGSLHGTGGVFWTVVFDQAATGPRVLPLGYGNEVMHVDTATGSSEKWLYEPEYALGVAAVDQHGSLIVVAQDSSQAWRVLKVTGAGTAATVYSGTIALGYQQAVADSHGIWFTASDGVYFLSDSTGFVRVSDKQASPAGSCV
jgi:hypothetical protein